MIVLKISCLSNRRLAAGKGPILQKSAWRHALGAALPPTDPLG